MPNTYCPSFGNGPEDTLHYLLRRLHSIYLVEGGMMQWLARGALPMSLPAVRFRVPLGAEFSEKYDVSPSQSWDVVKMLCPSRSNATLDPGENEYLVGQRWRCVR